MRPSRLLARLSCRWRSRSLRRRVRRTSTRTGGATALRRRGRAAAGVRRRAEPIRRSRPRDRASRAARRRRVLIERYTRVVLSQPGASFPLQRLAQLYRERDGNIAKLVTDFETRAAQPGADQYAATVSPRGPLQDRRTRRRRHQDLRAGHRPQGDRPDGAPGARPPLPGPRRSRRRARALREGAAAADGAGRQGADAPHASWRLALDQKDWAAAKAAHKQLVTLEPTSLFVKAELGRELYNRGEYERAEAELKDVVAAATGDNRALAPALKELGRAQAKAHENAEALATLKRALATAGRAERAARGDLRDRHRDLPRRPAAAGAREAARGRAPERLRAPRAARGPLRGDGRLDDGHRDVQARARHRPAADRSAPADDPPAPGQRGPRQGDRRVRRLDPRGAEQPAVRLRGVRGAPAAGRPRRAR